MSRELELYCPHCQQAELCGPQQMLARLRSLAVLKREAQPQPELIVELFRCSAEKFICHACDQVGMQVREVPEESWETTRRCSKCKAAIPPERLELFPLAERCAACEAATEQDSADDREFCRKCGEVLQPRLRKGPGIARYEMTCPRCRG